MGAAQGSSSTSIEDRTYPLTFWDMPGKYLAICEVYIKVTKHPLFLLCFDVTNKTSLSALSEYVNLIREKNPGNSIVLVGTKCDVQVKSRDRITENKVRSFVGENNVEGIDIVTYIETSANRNENINLLKKVVTLCATQPKESWTNSFKDEQGKIKFFLHRPRSQRHASQNNRSETSSAAQEPSESARLVV